MGQACPGWVVLCARPGPLTGAGASPSPQHVAMCLSSFFLDRQGVLDGRPCPAATFHCHRAAPASPDGLSTGRVIPPHESRLGVHKIHVALPPAAEEGRDAACLAILRGCCASSGSSWRRTATGEFAFKFVYLVIELTGVPPQQTEAKLNISQCLTMKGRQQISSDQLGVNMHIHSMISIHCSRVS